MVYISGKCKREARIAGAGIAGQRMMNVALRVRKFLQTRDTQKRDERGQSAGLGAWQKAGRGGLKAYQRAPSRGPQRLRTVPVTLQARLCYKDELWPYCISYLCGFHLLTAGAKCSFHHALKESKLWPPENLESKRSSPQSVRASAPASLASCQYSAMSTSERKGYVQFGRPEAW